MLTLGVDLAAADKRTAMAAIEWLPDSAVARDLVLDVSDVQVVQVSHRADKTAVDCPLGWPVPFVEFIAAHQSGHVSSAPGSGSSQDGEGPVHDLGEPQGVRALPRSNHHDRQYVHAGVSAQSYGTGSAEPMPARHPITRDGVSRFLERRPAGLR